VEGGREPSEVVGLRGRRMSSMEVTKKVNQYIFSISGRKEKDKMAYEI